MLGDQVYADEVSPKTLEFIRARREHGRAAVGAGRRLRGVHAPLPRGLVGARSSAGSSRRSARRCSSTTTTSTTTGTSRSSGSRRCARSPGGTTASPGRWSRTGSTSTSETSRRRSSPRWTCCARCSSATTRGRCCCDWAEEADRGSQGRRWSYSRTIGRKRFVFMDSREGRVLGEKPRRMFDEDEWDWINERVVGNVDHLVVADTLPVMMPAPMQDVEAWNEAVCDGAWGSFVRADRREDPPGPGPRALGRLPAFLPPAHRPVRRGRRGQARSAARDDRHPRRRHPPRLPGRGRVPSAAAR